MSEEEKEAIEELKNFSNLIIEGGIPNSLIVNKLKITFNLIDKLQKENEELKELVGFTTIRIKTDDIKMLTKDFISKDKIRTKIKELEKEMNREDIQEEHFWCVEAERSVLVELLGE